MSDGIGGTFTARGTVFHNHAMRDTPSLPPLAAYGGRVPPAPAWFDRVIAQAPERSTFTCDGVAIELLTWGAPGKPGLLFLHGDSAHADWWSFVAPFFASDWRCAAISWSGMGGSGWRADGYPLGAWATEAIAAIDAAGLDADGRGVTLVAHSLGGYPALMASARSARIRGIVALDSAILPKGLLATVPRPVPRPHRLYTSQTEALARFHFMPSSIGTHPFAIDHVARRSMMAVEQDGAHGWRWRFDPMIWSNMDERTTAAELPMAARCPLALIVGEESELIGAAVARYMRGLYPPDTPFVAIPGAGHHLMIDQPLALVAALRMCLDCWPH